ncbi:hypothetical protein RI543_002310 [Arxiozyma heterogenica]|uniref:Uncharacterized protein n=1 Tax=Arxiozyma heterogenica TaxID=278026 RepID=A0AAN7ZY07_9SACH|nr:hypothetical protein RI543_002310 [Kazachstania heterogenica]
MDDKVNKPGANPRTHSRSSSLLEIIFGPQIKDVINETNELPEPILSKAIDLKIEQEKTKQQYYKLANIDKCLELIKLSKGYGMPSQHLIHLINNNGFLDSSISKNNKLNNTATSTSDSVSTATTVESNNNMNITPVASMLKSTSPYKFPPADPLVSNNFKNSSNIGINTTERRTFHRRTHSPARIGASAVAAFNGDSNMISHNRNISLPIMNKFVTSSIPTNMVSVLNFESNKETLVPVKNNLNGSTYNNSGQSDKTSNNNNNKNSSSNSHNSPAYSNTNLSLESNNNCYLKRPVPLRSSSGNSVQKKTHRRTKSATVIPTFGVIDLNVIDQAASFSKSPVLSNNNITKANGTPATSTTNNDTCSESSSTKGVDSPTKVSLYPQKHQYKVHHPNSLNRLLNDY